MIRRLFFLPLVFSCICLPSYGQNVGNPYAGLNGNWHLSTSGFFKHSDPYFSIGVDGDKFYAEGSISVTCTAGATQEGAGIDDAFDVVLEGEIGADGSFTLESEKAVQAPAHAVSIRGKLPVAGSTQWSGNLAVSAYRTQTNPTQFDCPAISVGFTAIPFGSFNGSYSGTIGTRKPEPEGYISLRISQGSLSMTDPPGPIKHVIPVKASIRITGSTEFPSDDYKVDTISIPIEGATEAGAVSASMCCNKVYGKEFSLIFIHRQDGTEFSAHGVVDPLDNGRIQLMLRYIHLDANGNRALAVGFARLTCDDDKASR